MMELVQFILHGLGSILGAAPSGDPKLRQYLMDAQRALSNALMHLKAQKVPTNPDAE